MILFLTVGISGLLKQCWEVTPDHMEKYIRWNEKNQFSSPFVVCVERCILMCVHNTPHMYKIMERKNPNGRFQVMRP